MKKLITVILILLITPLWAISLKWDLKKDDRIEIVRTAQVKFLINRKVQRIYQERNIIDLTSIERIADSSRVKGTIKVFHRDKGSSVFHLREEHKTKFLINPNGTFNVKKKFVMPNLRNIPAFLKQTTKIGQTWTKTGELVFNNFSRPFKLSFPVKYKLVGIKKYKGKNLAKIAYSFEIKKNLKGKGLPSDFPWGIFAKYIGVTMWDIDGKQPYFMNDVYHIKFIMRVRRASFSVYEYRMNIVSKPKVYRKITKKDKNKAKNELKKVIPKNSNIDVDTDKRGLVIRMGGILFDFDSARLKPKARKNLDKIIAILKKKYPDREIIVEGHTDSVGSRRYNKGLSSKRARSVAQYLKKKGFHDKLSYRGLGSTKPIKSNKTATGREKNRRVEMIIKLH